MSTSLYEPALRGSLVSGAGAHQTSAPPKRHPGHARTYWTALPGHGGHPLHLHGALRRRQLEKGKVSSSSSHGNLLVWFGCHLG